MYYSFIDKVSGFSWIQVARVFKLVNGASIWGEINNPTVLKRYLCSTCGRPKYSDMGSQYTYINYTKVISGVKKACCESICSPPTVLSTMVISNTTSTSVNAGRDITSDGGTTITQTVFLKSEQPSHCYNLKSSIPIYWKVVVKDNKGGKTRGEVWNLK